MSFIDQEDNEDEDNSIIITLAFFTHGTTIIASNAHKEKFNNVRVFSLSGMSQPAYRSLHNDYNYLASLNYTFQRHLTEPSASIIDRYREDTHKTYERTIHDMSDVESENTCKIFNKVTHDKILGTSIPSSYYLYYLEEMSKLISIEGVFVISVHRKRSNVDFELIYPRPENIGSNLNLFDITDFSKFARMFGKELPEYLVSMSSPEPSNKDIIKSIEEDQMILFEEKRKLIKQQEEIMLQSLSTWNILISPNSKYIISVKMSFLINEIKKLVGPLCKINVIDFSCSMVSSRNPSISHYPFSQTDIVTNKTWGGKKSKRNKKTQKENKNKNKREIKKKSKRKRK
jgi:hypothetical protein